MLTSIAPSFLNGMARDRMAQQRPAVRLPHMSITAHCEPHWHHITGSPDRCRELEKQATLLELPLSWYSREGALWQFVVYCTDGELFQLEGEPQAA